MASRKDKTLGNMAKLLKSASVFGGWTFISRIFGLVRDILFARFLGAGLLMDVFKVTFSIPNYFRRLFGEGAFLQSFVPVLNEVKEQQDENAVRRLVGDTAGTLGAILFLITVISIIAAPIFIMIFAPGFVKNPEAMDLAVTMLRWMFPYLLFISLVALASGVLNTYGKFAVPAFTPILLNLCLIVTVVWIAPNFPKPTIVIAIGVFVAGVVQLLFQYPFLRKIKMISRPRWAWKSEGVQKIFKLMLPGIFGSSVAQINLIIDSAIATMLGTGAVSYLYYSDRLMEFPLGIFGIAIATVALPKLSSQFSNQDEQGYSETLDWSLRLAFLICLPAAVGLVCLAAPLLATLFQYGNFDAKATQMAQYSLWAYGFGLFGFVLVKVLVPAYFSRQDTVTPVKFGIVAMGVNIVLNLIVLALFLTKKWTFAPHAGLALATSIGAFVNAGLLFSVLRKKGIYQLQSGWLKFLAKIILACMLMAVVVLMLRGDISLWTDAGLWQRLSRLAILIGAGVATYFATLFIFGMRPRDFLKN